MRATTRQVSTCVMRKRRKTSFGASESPLPTRSPMQGRSPFSDTKKEGSKKKTRQTRKRVHKRKVGAKSYSSAERDRSSTAQPVHGRRSSGTIRRQSAVSRSQIRARSTNRAPGPQTNLRCPTTLEDIYLTCLPRTGRRSFSPLQLATDRRPPRLGK